jgi:hypothetical protein
VSGDKVGASRLKITATTTALFFHYCILHGEQPKLPHYLHNPHKVKRKNSLSLLLPRRKTQASTQKQTTMMFKLFTKREVELDTPKHSFGSGGGGVFWKERPSLMERQMAQARRVQKRNAPKNSNNKQLPGKRRQQEEGDDDSDFVVIVPLRLTRAQRAAERRVQIAFDEYDW